MRENNDNLRLIEKNLYKTIANFMVVWFVIIICFYLLASLSAFAFIFTMSGLGAFGPSLLILFFVEGFFIFSLIITLKNYKVILLIDKNNLSMLNLGSLICFFVFALIALFGILATVIGNLSTYESLPITVIANQGVADIFLDFVLFTAVLVSILGIILLVKNIVSATSRLFFLSFLSIGMACLFYILYIMTYPLIVIDVTTEPVSVTQMPNPLVTIFFFLFFMLIQLGFYILIHAISSISFPGEFWLQKRIYFLFVILGVLSTILLFSGEIEHVFLDLSYLGDFVGSEQVGPTTFAMYYEGSYFGMPYRVREYSLAFSIIYLLIQLIPIIISLFYLSKLPPWITPERRAWLNRIKLGIIVYALFPICETIAGIRIPLTTGFVSAYNPLERYKLILSVSFLILALSILILFSGVPKLEKWFFDEIKFRSSPELRILDPNVNLAAIWELVDDWQKESELTPKEMTNQKLEEYIQAAKNLVIKEEGKPLTL
ncbi:MAG: hypothetical protein ACXADY_25430 [Candidatus Hodarchaeales archaeon]|jgi:hypothetical protein